MMRYFIKLSVTFTSDAIQSERKNQFILIIINEITFGQWSGVLSFNFIMPAITN